jgi:TonB family protein
MVRISLCLAMVAALAAPAAAQSGQVYGSLTDESGGVLPAVEVRALLRDESGETVRSVVTDGHGTYKIDGMTPGQWTITASLPGFETATRRQVVQNGDTLDWSPTLEVGSLQETVTITTSTTNEPERRVAPARPDPAGAAVAPTAPRSAPRTGAVRVGGNIKPPRKITNVNPIYPSDAAAQGIAGVVILRAMIDADGTVRNVETLRSPNDSLTTSAATALSAWEFTPTLLNGTPTAVRMTATFNFVQN